MKPSIQELFDRLSRRLDDLEARLKRPEEQLGHRAIFSSKRSGEVPAAPSPTDTNRWLREDGQWTVVTAEAVVSGTNIGVGVGIHASASAGEMTFRSITGSAVSVTLSGSTVIISGSAGTSVSGTNVGVGVGIHEITTAGAMSFRSLTGSGAVSVALSGSTVVVSGSATPSLLGIGLGFFGDGSDGDADLDGSSTVLGMVPASIGTNVYGGMGAVNRYGPTRDMHFNNLTINSGTFLSTNHRVFVKGTLTLHGFIGFAGVNGSNGTAVFGGAGGTAGGAGSLGQQSAGGAGGAPAGAAVAGGAATTCPPFAENTGGTAGAIGGNGAAGGRMKGGGGGGGRTGTGIGGAAGIVTAAGSGEGSLSNLIQAVTGRYLLNNSRYSGGSGGAGGRGVGAGSGGGGGGGSSGGPVLVCARYITGSGYLWADGGNGGNGYQSAMSANEGSAGGGGGGGGWVACIIGYGDFPNMTANGGIGGTATNTGTGNAGNGGAGGNGFTYQFMIGVTPP